MLYYEFCGKLYLLLLNKSREESKYVCIVQYIKVYGEYFKNVDFLKSLDFFVIIMEVLEK